MIKRITVFCGSNHGTDPVFTKVAIELGKVMVQNQIGLVYGGGNVGLMGKIADSVMEAGGEVIGVIPEFMMEKELAHTNITQLVVTDSMHERKAKMAALSDAFIAMPGGIGTLEELIEVYTWLQLRIIQKPVALLNVENYYLPLIQMLDNMVDSGFLKNAHRRRLITHQQPAGLIQKLINNHYVFEETWYVTE